MLLHEVITATIIVLLSNLLQEKQQRSRTRLSRVERGDGSQWLSSSRKRGEADAQQAESMEPTEHQSAEECRIAAKPGESVSEEEATEGKDSNLSLHSPSIQSQKAVAESSSQGAIPGAIPFEDSDANKLEFVEDKIDEKGHSSDLNVRPWTEGDSGRVPVWDTRTQRILWGNCAPLARNIGRYLESHPTMKVWAGEGRQRFAADGGAKERWKR